MAKLSSRKIKPYLTQEQLAERVKDLGEQITRHYESVSEPLVVLSVLKGSVIFVADLCRHIDLPLELEFMGVSSYGEATVSSGVVQITQDLKRPISGKHVLLVEDIIDTGLTVRYLLDNFQRRSPASIKVCSLLEKPSKNQGKVAIDFLGFSIPDEFVVGYGLDLAEVYRNLPYVGVLENG